MTGKTKIQYFFDPSLVLPEDDIELKLRTPLKRSTNTSSSVVSEQDARDTLLYSSKHLFMPCVIVKDLDGPVHAENEVPALVKTTDGVLHKIRVSSSLYIVTNTVITRATFLRLMATYVFSVLSPKFLRIPGSHLSHPPSKARPFRTARRTTSPLRQ